ncbi:Pentatricopeptide repeat [Arabidopsis suecica]|uniref:Pentatricopeptide repeat n=1 Tax=Arabidopsis suecica TaxID=45249 RepID=A0A8T2B435_ARASU|nr:Pentatricopeptide repeat [Arabidopsis suecica]
MTVLFLRIEIQILSVGTLRFLPRNPDLFAAIKPSSALASLYSTVSGQIEENPKRYEHHNVATSIATLQRCAQKKDSVSGQQIHGFMVRKGFLDDSPRAVTSLVNMYAKCGLMRRAVSVFGGSERDVFGYNALISGFVVNGSPLDAMEMYREMRAKGILPDKYTFPSLLKGSDAMEISDVKKVHGLAFKLGFDSDCYVGSALVTSYSKFMSVEDAQKVFDELPDRDDSVLWNALVNGYSQIFRFEDALIVFSKMREEGVGMSRHTITSVLSAFTVSGDIDNGRSIHGLAVKKGFDSDIVVSNALIDMYGKSKWLEEANSIFEAMDERDLFTWNSVLCVHDYCGDHDGTLALFERMLCSGIRPDIVTLTTVLPTCGRLASLKQGREIHGYMIVNGLVNRNSSNEYIHNSLMDMYVKCGDLRDARMVFDLMRVKDSASWNIMINGYGVQSCGELALDMFSCMCRAGVKPDEITFVGLLQACSHSGFVSEGRNFLAQMETVYNILPTSDHYACVIDMLGRADKLEEAYELAISMPVCDNPVVWRSILSSCRLHGNKDLALVAGKRLYELEPEHCGGYVLMSNVYVEAGKFEEVLDVRDTMKEQNVKKTPGCSWIRLKNGFHTFFTGDQTHPEFESIHPWLSLLISHMHGLEYMTLDD